MVSYAQKKEANISEIVNWHQEMLLKAVFATKNSSATLMDIAFEMINISSSAYEQGLERNFIENGFLLPKYHTPSLTYVVVPNTKFQQLCLQETADLTALKKKTTFASSKGKKQEEDGDSCVIL